MPALVLIPGLLCDQRLWSSQIAALTSEADITVADITQQLTISEMAAAVLERAPAHFSLAGFSLGSQVALEIMRTSPMRIDRLALLSTTHGGLLPPVQIALRRAIATIERGNFDQYLEAAYPTYVAESRAEDLCLKRSFLAMAYTIGPAAGLRQMQALLAISAAFTNLDHILCPTVIVGGQEDRRTTPAAHETLAREIPGSGLVIVPNAGHFTPLEQPGFVAELLQRWMTS
ncbi:MAG: alpha/beta hydrolase [Acidobacteriaceae bacterium]|nr:alpha/beta hydrolase [Acidobacteriaceae bacterium]